MGALGFGHTGVHSDIVAGCALGGGLEHLADIFAGEARRRVTDILEVVEMTVWPVFLPA